MRKFRKKKLKVISFKSELVFIILFVLAIATGSVGYGTTNNEANVLKNEIIFIDESVNDYSVLISDLNEGDEYYLINSQRNGIKQIAEILLNKSDISNIHIISHGKSGQINIGNTYLNSDNLEMYSEELDIVKNALTSDGTILLYGCEVAEGKVGERFIKSLGESTGADVVASIDKTGGVDWELEYAYGNTNAKTLQFDKYNYFLGLEYTSDTNPVITAGATTDDGDYRYIINIDVDTDGDQDFISYDGDSFDFYINDGSGTFTKTIPNVTLPLNNASEYLVADFDNDGDDDIYAPGVYYTNDGSGSFTSATNPVGAAGATTDDGSIRYIVNIDYDTDGDQDFIAYDGDFYVNDGSGNFTKTILNVTLPKKNGSDYLVADFDNDGDEDIYAPGGYYTNDGSGLFTSATNPVGAAGATTDNGTTRYIVNIDYDTDGDQDFIAYDGDSFDFYVNDGSGNFTKTAPNAILPLRNASEYLVVDFDNDGDEDIFAPTVFFTQGGTVGGTNNRPPRISSTTPSDNSTDISSSANIILNFDETISSAGTGVFEIYKSSDDSLVESIAGNDSKITGTGSSSITVNLTNTLNGSTSYYIQIKPSALYDADGMTFLGVNDKTTLNFTTGASVPMISSLTPSDNASGIDINGDLSITFSVAVDVETGNILIKKTSDDSIVETIDVTGAQVTGTGTNTITINPSVTLESETEYYVQLSATTFDDSSSNSFAGITDTISWSFTTADITAPTLSILSPLDNATGIGVNADLSIVFNESVDVETGNILIKKTSDDSIVETIDVTSGQVTGTGTNTITINPSVTLESETEYYVQLSATTFDDSSSNSFAGITDTISWSFTTADVNNPTLSILSPLDNATGIGLNADLSIVFNKSVDVETGNILIKKTSDDSIVETIDVTGAQVTGTGTNTITINPSVTLESETEYYVQLSATTFDDSSSNSFAGITDTISWSFTTADVNNPTLSSLSPLDNATGIGLNADLSIVFNKSVDVETGNILIKKTSDDSIVETIDVTSGQVTGTGTTTITINPSITFASETAYYVQLSATTFDDSSSNSFAGITDTISWSFTTADVNAPTLSRLSPLNNSTGIGVNSDLSIVFSESVYVKTGNILIKKTSDNSLVERIDVTSAQVTGTGTNTITINPSVTFASETSYYIQITETAFDDSGIKATDVTSETVTGAGIAITIVDTSINFAGITDTSSWRFTTSDVNDPIVNSLTPLDNATNVGVNTDLSIVFNESVYAETGNIIIRKTSDDSLVETIDVTSGQITGTGTNTITIDPSVTFAYETSYYVQIATTAFDDNTIKTTNVTSETVTGAGVTITISDTSNSFAGITDTRSWNFITEIASSSRKKKNPKPEEIDPEPKETEIGIDVIVNGESKQSGTETILEVDGEKKVEIVLDGDVLKEKIDQILKKLENGDVFENTIEVPVTATEANNIKTVLTGDVVKKMEDNEFKLAIKTEDVDYIIPASEITIANIAKVLDVEEGSLKAIEIEIVIRKLETNLVQEIIARAESENYEIIFPPVDFTIVAKTTSKNGEKKEIEISKFNSYIERVMEIPDGIDPTKITTGVVYNPDGTFSHVPTVIYEKNGRWYAKLNSLTNSSYSVIWNSIRVESVENHWSKDAVNDMVARLIVDNPDAFSPDEDITRGEFTEYVTKALGIYRTNIAVNGQFVDVNSTSELADAITVAVEYGIIHGYPDGSFRPDKAITREEAMVVYAKAMNIVKLSGKDTNRINNYEDHSSVSEWAKEYIKDVLAAKVFNGTTATLLTPKANLTYSEAVQAIKNLLVESGLINN